MGPLFTSSGTLAFTIPSQPLGYSLVILDNGGSGFSGAATVNLTYQAALDEKRRLDSALAARPDYQPSSDFQAAYNAAVTHVNTANGAYIILVFSCIHPLLNKRIN